MNSLRLSLPLTASIDLAVPSGAGIIIRSRTETSAYKKCSCRFWIGLRCGFPAAASLGRAARGSVAPRKMACRAAAGAWFHTVQGHQLAHREGQPGRCPF
jgi:hypothetical protein